MTESQRIVLNVKAELRSAGWPENAIKSIVSALCEAGYRQCIDDIQAKAARDNAIIQKAVEN